MFPYDRKYLCFERQQSRTMESRGWENRMKPIFISPWKAWAFVSLIGIIGLAAALGGGLGG